MTAHGLNDDKIPCPSNTNGRMAVIIQITGVWIRLITGLIAQ